MATMQAGDSPFDHTVDEVNTYLATADDEETARVLAEEASGKNRVTVSGATAPAVLDKPVWNVAEQGPPPEGQDYTVVAKAE